MTAIRSLILALAVLSPPACGTSDQGGGTVGESTLSLVLADAAADLAFGHANLPSEEPATPDVGMDGGRPEGAAFEAAVLTISSIYLVGEGGQLVLNEQPVTTDLMTLSNDVKMLVDGAVVPSGRYEQLRFVIVGAYIQVAEGDAVRTYSTADYAPAAGLDVDGELMLPSYAESGFKVVLPDGGISLEDEQQILIVGFDVGESFGQVAGVSGQWVMNPALVAESLGMTAEMQVHVRLSPTAAMPPGVTLASFSAQVVDRSLQGGVVKPLADRDGDGIFEATFQFLDPQAGPFWLGLTAPEGVTFTTDAHLPIQVVLTSGETQIVGIMMTSVSAPSPGG